MASFDETKTKAHIKSKNFFTLYLFEGEEAYLKSFFCKKLVDAALGGDINDFNFNKFSGSETELSTVFELAMQYPMMSEKSVIVVDDFPLDSISDADFDLLQKSGANLPETTLLIFFQDISKISKRDKGKKVLKLFDELGAVVSLQKRTGAALYRSLSDYAASKGLKLSSNSAQYLVQEVGDDYSFLINEMDKLISFVQSGEITNSAIDAICIKTPETRIYYLMDFLQSGQFAKAYEVYNILVYNKTEPEYILGVIASSILDLYRYKAALISGYTSNEARRLLEYKGKDYPFNKMMGRVNKYSMQSIRKMLDVVSKTDLKIKRQRNEANLVLEILLVELYEYMR